MFETQFLAGLLLVNIEGGAITPIMDWLHIGAHQVAP
jgi:hypothetical protein